MADLCKLEASWAAEREVDRRSQAMQLTFALTEEHLAALNRMYDPLRFTGGTKVPTDHPLMAAHLQAATKFAYDEASQLTDAGVLEIGPNLSAHLSLARGKRGRVHGCSLFGPRDQARHIRSAAALRKCGDDNYSEAAKMLSRGISNSRLCIEGAHNCTFPAEHAVAIHSLYDISFRQLADIFQKHGLYTMTAYMHFPTAMLQPIRCYTDATQGWVASRSGSRMRFSFINDASFCYEHDYSTWFNYLLTSGYHTPYGFSILIEKVRHWGSQYELKLTRVVGREIFIHTVPTGLETVTFVPDVVEAARRHFYPSWRNSGQLTPDNCPPGMRWIPTARAKVGALMDYLIGRDHKGFTTEAAFAYARSQKRAITIGSKLAEHAWDISTEDFHAVVVSVYVITSINRALTGAVVKEADIHSQRQHLWWYQRWFHDFLLGPAKDLLNIGHVPVLKPGNSNFVHKLALYNPAVTVLRQQVGSTFFGDLKTAMRPFKHMLGGQPVYDTCPAPPPGFDKCDEPEPYIPPGRPQAGSDAGEIREAVLPPGPIVTQGQWQLDEDNGLALLFPEERGRERRQPTPGVMIPEELFHVEPTPDPAPLNFEPDHFQAPRYDDSVTDFEPAPMDMEQEIELEARFERDTRGYLTDIRKTLAQTPPTDALWPVFNGAMVALTEAVESAEKYVQTAKITFIIGVPGAGKTKRALELVRPGDLVVVPTRELRESWLRKTGGDVTVVTQHVGVTRAVAHKGRRIFVDEAFTFPACVLVHFARYGSEVYALGDPCQIGFINFSQRLETANLLRADELARLCKRRVISLSHRCPQDVVELPLIRAAYGIMRSASNRLSSIIRERIEEWQWDRKSPILCYTQGVKEILRYAYPEAVVNTIHEVQGRTFQRVTLYYTGSEGERNLWLNSAAHTVVGVTRHTKRLVIASNEDILTCPTARQLHGALFLNITPNVSSALELAAAPVVADDLVRIEPAANVERVSEAFALPSMAQLPADVGALMMEALCPTRLREAPYTALDRTDFPAIECGRSKFSVSTMIAKTVDGLRRERVHRTFPGPPLGRVSVSSIGSNEVAGAITRLCKRTANLDQHAAREFAHVLFKRLCRYVDFEAVANNPTILHTATTEMLYKFTQRGHDDSRLNDPIHDPIIKCELHAKEQFKADFNDGAFEKDKACQTITAWSKSVNFTVAAWARVVEIALLTQSKNGFLFASRMCEEDLMARLSIAVNTGDRVLANDFTEFDSSQNNVERELASMVLAAVGCPREVIERYCRYRQERFVTSRSFSTVVRDKRDSGEPFTLVGNTVFCAAVTLFCVKGNVTFAAFKGDDSIVAGPDLEWSRDIMDDLSVTCGFKLKPEVGSCAEFVGYIVTPGYCVPDLLRIAAKMTGKRFPNKDKYEEYCMSLKDRLKGMQNNPGLAREWAVVNAAFHQKEPREIETLLDFLVCVANGKVEYNMLEKRHFITRLIGGDPGARFL